MTNGYYKCVTCGYRFVARSDKPKLECLVCLWDRAHGGVAARNYD